MEEIRNYYEQEENQTSPMKFAINFFEYISKDKDLSFPWGFHYDIDTSLSIDDNYQQLEQNFM